MARLKFQDLNKEQLWALRKEITLNSLFIADYENSFGFAAKSVCDFFDGYMNYLWELADGDGKKNLSVPELVKEYDNEDNLFDHYWGADGGYDWVEYDPAFTEEEEKEYEGHWNGTK